jgi:two-component system chemotaxis response regulator CheY
MAKILIVDDSSLARRILRNILEPAAHQVTEAADGIAALEQYFLDKPDLVLLDLTMAGMHGLDVLAKLREMDPRARVIVASADIQTQTRDLALAGGALGFINKPFIGDQVLETVTHALQSVV